MRLIIFLTFMASVAFGGLPPTSTKLQSETNASTSFFFEYPRLTGTHTGVTTTFGGEIVSTGVVSGAILSINANPALFDLAAGVYQFFDYTVSTTNPTVKEVTCGPFAAQTITNLASADSTYISLSSACAIIQSTTFPTPQQRRQNAFVGRLSHANHTSLTSAITLPDFLIDTNSQLYDLFDAIGAFNISGNIISANGANLSFNRSAGSVFRRSANYVANNQNPNITTTAASTPQTFIRATQNTINVTPVTVLDIANYDNAGTVTAIGGGINSATNQRVYLFSNGTVGVQYGQVVYGSLAAALAGITGENFIVNPQAVDGGILIGIITCIRTATDLSNSTQCAISKVGRFDQTGVTAGATSTTTLQQAYTNSVQPQITLNSTQLGVQFRDASTPIGSSLFAIQNNAGSTNYLGVDVNGISTTNFVGTGTAGAVRVHNLTTAQKNALTPAAGMIVYDTTLTRMECYVNGSWGACTRPVLSTQTPTAGSSLTLDLTVPVQRIRLTPASAISLSTTVPFGSSAPVDGAIIIAVGTSDTNTVTFTASDTAKGIWDYDITLGRGDIATFIYSATDDRYYYLSTGK